MKKLLSLCMVVVLLLSMAACQKETADTATTEAPSATQDASTQNVQDASTEEREEEPDTDNLVLYTSASASEYELIVSKFNEKYPNINVEVVTGGSGEIASRVTAEKDAPYGDVMMGGGDTTYRGIAECIEPYTSTEVDNLFAEFVPEDSLYTPCYVNVNSIIVNKTMIEELGVEITGWESLCDERLKGNISFADPAESSSALEVIVNMLAAMNGTGELDDGWTFVERFVRNLDGKFASSSSAAYKAVVEGEYAVGLCNEDKVISYMKDGADVYPVYAEEGITLRTSNIALIKGGANVKNAKLFIDFVVSQECQAAMEAEVNVRPIRSDVPLTTEGRIATDELVSIAYPEVTSSELKEHFSELVTSIG